MAASNVGLVSRCRCEEVSAVAKGTAAASGAGVATGSVGVLAARLLVAGRGSDGGLTADSSGQREATVAGNGFASNTFARGAAGLGAAAAAGGAAFSPSLRFGGSSARALATARCEAGSACGAGGFAGGKIF